MLRRLLRLAGQGGICLAMLLGSTSIKAELVIGSPPWGTEEHQRAIFEPIAKAMSGWLGTKVVYRYSNNFTTFSLAMRGEKFDFVFDGPHFNAWRMASINHTPVVNLPEQLQFMVVTGADNKTINTTEDLIGKRVCGQSPPQLGTLLLWHEYKDPARQPVLQAIKGEAKVYDNLKSGKCPIAILRNSTYLRMDETEKAKYKLVFTSRSVPNLALSASPNVTEKQRRILAEKLTDAKTAGVFKPIFDKYVKTATRFEKAEPKEYEGLEMVLKNGSYGW